MKDKIFKNILNEWRCFLNETASIEKINKQIEKLEDINTKTNLDYKIKIKKLNKDKFVIGYTSSVKDIRANVSHFLASKENKKPEMAPELYGSIDIVSSKEMLKSDYDNPELEVPGKGEGEVNSTWYVRLTSETKRGMGPLLYEVVIEFVSTYLNACIKPDPTSVSDAAISVWEKYLQRSDVITKQLDINSDDITYYRREYPDQFEDKGHRKLEPLTPQTSDDTSQFSAMDHMGYMWPESPLSKAYRKGRADIIELLIAKGLIVLDI